MNVLIGFLPEFYPAVECFRRFGQCVFMRYDRAYLEAHINDFDLIVPHLFEHIDADLIARAKRLRMIATPSTGTDHLDLKAMEDHGIALVSLNDDRKLIDGISSTAEMAWLLILACSRNLRSLIHRVEVEDSWSNTDIRGHEVAGKTIGIIGFGRLGKFVARYAHAFGMRVIANDPDASAFTSDPAAESVSLDRLLAESDVVSLHAKLNDTSRLLLGAAELARIKPGAILVNTARGGLVDSEAVLAALDDGRLAAVGFDTVNGEFQSARIPDDPVIAASRTDRRILVTPHAGGSTLDAHAKVFGRLAELAKARLAKERTL